MSTSSNCESGAVDRSRWKAPCAACWTASGSNWLTEWGDSMDRIRWSPRLRTAPSAGSMPTWLCCRPAVSLGSRSGLSSMANGCCIRDAYPPKLMPQHVVVVGSGVTGVEFVHMFESMGS